MSNDERFWEFRFKTLNEQYTQLKEEYCRIKDEYISQFHVIDKLEKENLVQKSQIETYKANINALNKLKEQQERFDYIDMLEEENISLKHKIDECDEEYSRLKEDYSARMQALDAVNKENSMLKTKIEELNLGIERLQKQEIRRSSNNESLNEFAKSQIAKWPRMLNSLTLFLPNSGLYERYQADNASTECPSETHTTGKTPQVNPDQSLVYDNLELRLLESFYLLGIPTNSIGKLQSCPEVLYEFQGGNTDSSNKKILMDFCFPNETQCRPVRYSASEEEINNILFGQEQELRGSNCYIFTLRSNEPTEGLIEYSELPNSDKEIIYCICVQVEDIGIDTTRDSEWIYTKCLCLMTYIPFFDLHFQFLRALLQLQKLWRMETLTAFENIRVSLRKNPEEIPPKWEDLLQKYVAIEGLTPGCGIILEDQLIPSIELKLNEDLSMIDIPWLLSPLLSLIDPQDFLWLLSALIQEKSIVFVSYNLEQLTNCVLGMQALLRPFKWPYLLIPLIPDSLRELLEAPIPILAGLPGSAPEHRKNMPHLIWVYLDEPSIKKRVQYSPCIFQEVQELPNPQAKQDILASFNEKNQETQIATHVKSIWKCIIDKFKGNHSGDPEALSKVVNERFSPNDQPFMQSLLQTQMFINLFDENIN